MPEVLVMPQVGESVTEGTVLRWLKREGDRIERDEPIVEVETEKVDVEIPSPWAGVLERIVAREGETVPVGEPLAYIAAKAGARARVAKGEAGAAARAAGAPKGGPAPAKAEAPAAPRLRRGSRRVGERRRHSPAVLRLAQEHGVDLAQVRGSGIDGRVTRKDVLAWVREHGAAPAPAPSVEVLPLTPTRRTIAERMAHSSRTVPHAWMAMEVDVTSLAAWRESIKEDFRRSRGADLTFLPFAVKATADSLKEHPLVNASWSDEGIVLKKEINVGVAVAADEGLIVPVVRGADGKGIAALAQELSDLAARARARKLSIADVEGGTFTVDNTGVFGSVLSRAIINEHQAAILTLEAVVKRPVVVDDAIAIRSMVNLCLSFDHRILDGAQAARFLESVVRRLEGYGPDTPLE
jgi:2-oxoisovalerate dehydrogenase E2 component (dihydrolipoyl transacylase)